MGENVTFLQFKKKAKSVPSVMVMDDDPNENSVPKSPKGKRAQKIMNQNQGA